MKRDTTNKNELPKVAMIPAISPLYRLFVWEKMAESTRFNIDFYCETQNNIDNIKYISEEVLNAKFKWYRIQNFYFGKTLWQKGTIKIPFMNYDVIIYSGNIRCVSTWLSSILARMMGKKVYFWSHGVYGKENNISLFIKKLFLSIPTGNFFYGDRALQKVLSWNFSKEQNHVIYNSLDYDFHKKMRAIKNGGNVYQTYFKNKNPVLLFIGRLTKIKKLDQLLTAVSLLQEKGLRYNVIFIGGGSEKEKLEILAEKNNIQAWFYGECYDESLLHNLIRKADLCVSPGNVGLTLIHCLSYGTPVLTHNDFDYQMPEAEAIRPGFNGDFFKKDSPKDLSEKIKEWFEKNADVDRDEIKQNCYSIIDDKYNPYFQTELIEKVINNIPH